MAEAVSQQTPAAPVTPTPAPALVPGTPEYDAAMAAKGTPAVEPPAPARVEGLPEKFKTVADLAASYAELEKKLGTPKPADPKPADTTPADPNAPKAPESKLAIPEQKAADDAVKAAGLDMAALSAEFAETGDLKPESYEKLEKSGIPKPMVEAYIAGQKALAAQYDATAHDAAGGAEQYTKMVDWAAKNLSTEQKVAFNAAVTSGDKGQLQLAVAGLRSQFEANFGKNPGDSLQGNTHVAGDVYASMEEMKADMRDPRYKKDPAFNAKVVAKAGRSTFGNIIER